MKNLLAKLIIVLMFISSINSAIACNTEAGQISYVNIGGSSYKVTVGIYTACGAGCLVPVKLHFECGSDSSLEFTAFPTLIGTGTDILSTCSTTPNPCNSMYNNKTLYTYETTVTLQPCADWEIYYSQDNRPSADNIYGISGTFYINSKLNNAVVGNSSPVFDNNMQPVMTYNNKSEINFGGVDPDGDSLSYSLYVPLNYNGGSPNQVSYLGAYSATNFTASSIPITLNPITGILTIQPSQAVRCDYGIEVKEWREVNGVMTNIGLTHRDFVAHIKNTYNILPVLGGFDFGSNNSYSATDTIYDTYRCFDGIPITFRIYGYDDDNSLASTPSENKIFDISWNNGLDNTVFTAHNNGTDSAYGEFVWTPDSSDFNIKKYFVVNIKDHACAYNGTNSKSFSITIVDDKLGFSNDMSVCNGDLVSIPSYNAGLYNYFNWTIDGDTIWGSNNKDTLIINSVDYSIGDHIIMLEASDSISGSACSQVQQMILTIDDGLDPNHFHDSTYCVGDSVVFDAGEADSYKWVDINGALLSTDRYYSETSSGRIIVEVINNSCVLLDTFTVMVYSPPTFSLGNDTTINTNQSLTLEMPIGYSDYLWSTGSTAQSIIVDNNNNWQNTITGRILEGGMCISADTIIVRIGSVGIIGIQNDNISIYPNPVDDVLYIKLGNESEDVRVQLYDISSKLIRNEVFSGKVYSLESLNGLSSGNYILRVINRESILEYKIIKK